MYKFLIQYTRLLLEAMLVWAVDVLVRKFLFKTILLVSQDGDIATAQ